MFIHIFKTRDDCEMKLFLSKKAFIIAALVLGNNAFSGTMGAVCTPGNVTVPCAASAWSLEAQALYLRPAYSNNPSYFNYDEIQNINGVNVYKELKTDWNWGFKLGGAYLFNTGNDVAVNWYHWNESHTYIYSRPSRDALSILTLHNQISPKWDAINAELGQYVNVGLAGNIRFHGGMQYAYLRHNVYSPYSLVSLDGTTGAGVNRLNLTRNGFGPRFGADLSYKVTTNFALYGNAAAAILAGNNRTVDSSDVNPSRGSYFTTTPELEAKLGVQYNHAMANGTLSFDAGYMWVNYFNTFYIMQSTIRGKSDFGLEGPYLGAKWIAE